MCQCTATFRYIQKFLGMAIPIPTTPNNILSNEIDLFFGLVECWRCRLGEGNTKINGNINEKKCVSKPPFYGQLSLTLVKIIPFLPQAFP